MVAFPTQATTQQPIIDQNSFFVSLFFKKKCVLETPTGSEDIRSAPQLPTPHQTTKDLVKTCTHLIAACNCWGRTPRHPPQIRQSKKKIKKGALVSCIHRPLFPPRRALTSIRMRREAAGREREGEIHDGVTSSRPSRASTLTSSWGSGSWSSWQPRGGPSGAPWTPELVVRDGYMLFVSGSTFMRRVGLKRGTHLLGGSGGLGGGGGGLGGSSLGRGLKC